LASFSLIIPAGYGQTTQPASYLSVFSLY